MAKQTMMPQTTANGKLKQLNTTTSTTTKNIEDSNHDDDDDRKFFLKQKLKTMKTLKKEATSKMIRCLTTPALKVFDENNQEITSKTIKSQANITKNGKKSINSSYSLNDLDDGTISTNNLNHLDNGDNSFIPSSTSSSSSSSSNNVFHNSLHTLLEQLPWKVLDIISSIGHIMRRSKQYLSSLRPGSFFTSLIPVLIGTVLAAKTTGQFSWILLLATLVTVLSVHAAGNLVNTYGDFMRGIDSKPNQSDDRTLVDSILTPEEVVNLGVLFYIIGCAGFLVVVLLSPARMELLALIYFGGLSSSFLYTGGIGLKYIALGDIIIMMTFGPVSVLYSFIVQTGTIRLVTLLYALPLALNTEAILHSNNTRDILVDRRSGCVTIAILIGPQWSHVLFALLLFIPYIIFIVVSLNFSTWWLLLPLITLPKAFSLEKQFRDGWLRHMPRQMAKLNFYFGMFYLFACFMAPSHKLPGLLPAAATSTRA